MLSGTFPAFDRSTIIRNSDFEPEEEQQDNQNVVTRTSPLAEYMYEEANDTTMIIKNARASSSQTMIHHAAAPLFKDE